MILTGKHIKSTSLLNETYFEDTVILITEHNDQGAIGFVMNRPYGRSLNDLDEFKQMKTWPLQEGGPVDQEHIYILHKRPDLISNGKKAFEGYYVGGEMNDVVNAIEQDLISKDQLTLFIGYCGWDGKELAQEIDEGSWTIDG